MTQHWLLPERLVLSPDFHLFMYGLLKLPFKKAFGFRIGMVKPAIGQVHVLKYYNYLGWLSPFLQTFFPNVISTMRKVANAMIRVCSEGYESDIIYVKDIRKLDLNQWIFNLRKGQTKNSMKDKSKYFLNQNLKKYQAEFIKDLLSYEIPIILKLKSKYNSSIVPSLHLIS